VIRDEYIEAEGIIEAINIADTNEWFGKALEKLRLSEYNISILENKNRLGTNIVYQAPNRMQNLRTFFSEDGVRVIQRTKSLSSWELSLSLRGIEIDRKFHSATSAERYISENRIDYQRGEITEWYVNGIDAIVQGFTIFAPPVKFINSNDIIFDLRVGGDLVPSLMDAENNIAFQSLGGTTVLLYEGPEAYDVNGYRLRTGLNLISKQQDDYYIRLTLDTTGAKFPVSILMNITNSTMLESTSGLSDTYDWGVAGSDDGGQLGYSVSTAGDVNNDGYDDVILGAPGYDSGHEGEGGAFLYLSDGNNLEFTPSWHFEANQDRARLGASVSDAGDVNNDGYDDVVIGAPDYDAGILDQGRVYVFYGSDDGLTDTLVTTIDGDAGDILFGESVGNAGDVNNDGYDDIIVGAPANDNGQAYVFLGTATGISITADWTATSSSVLDFGISVDTAGDVNGDGFADVIVGGSFPTGSGGGNAVIYHGSATGLGTAADTTLTGPGSDAEFGFSVSTAGDINRDGYDDVIVGAPSYNSEAGRVYAFMGSSSGINTTAGWSVDGDQSQAEFGYSVSEAGDLNGDGYGDVIIGAPFYNDYGRAYVYIGSADGLGTSPYWWSESDTLASQYGFSVSNAGNVNGDRTDDIIVGAPIYFLSLASQGIVVGFYGYPDITATNDSPTQIGDTTTFTSAVSISGSFDYEWDFGDGITETGQIVSHTYTVVDYYTATVTADDGTYVLSTTTALTITDIPIIDLMAVNDSPTEFEHTTNLTASVSEGTNVNYEWDFGDGSTGNGITVTHIYPAIDIFTATVTATNSVSTESISTTVTIIEAYIQGLKAENDSPTILGEMTTLSATIDNGSNVSYLWDFGDGEFGSGASVTHVYPAIDIYTATVTASNSINTLVATTTVNIKERISATIHIVPGWNLIALPVVPETDYMAQDLLDEVNIGFGASCNEVDRWLNGGWNAHIDGVSFNNFDINLGEGYFLKCLNNADWDIYGMEMWEEIPIDLLAGWTLISLPYPPNEYKAQSLLDRLNAEGDFCTEVDRWLNGGWNAHINGVGYNNFDIEPDQGYFVRCTSVNNSLDLSINKNDGGVTASAGSVLTYTISYSNTGTIVATGVVITETLPLNTDFNPDESNPAWQQVSATDTYTYSVGDLGVDGTHVVTFGITVDSPLPVGVSTITNTVEIGDDGSQVVDKTPDNNKDTILTPVQASTENAYLTASVRPTRPRSSIWIPSIG